MRAECVAIFGDYDVDGATSAALLARFLRHCGIEPIIHIPDRLFEGYGPNAEAVRALAERGATLLVCVDCGTTSAEALAEAKSRGLDIVVIDHHQADEELPPALAIVNPDRRDDLSGLGHLAAVGLTFMTVVAVNRMLRVRGFWHVERPEPDLLGFLADVALGTVADVVPLTGLNRAFVAKGLIALRRRERPGPCQPDGCGTAFRSARELGISGFCSGRGSMPAAASAAPIWACGSCLRMIRSRRQKSPLNSINSIASGRRLNRKPWRRPKPRRMPRSASRTKAQ